MRALTVEKCIRLPHRSQARLNRLARKGKIPAGKVGRGWLFVHRARHPRAAKPVAITRGKSKRPAGRMSFRAARSKTGMDWPHSHDFASELVNDGVDIDTEGVIPGHESAASTKRYTHLTTASLKNAILKIGGEKFA
jgi:site-specific recombinase XerD